jgi:D-tyrosyl-tRNA(Tyr) deacylase
VYLGVGRGDTEVQAKALLEKVLRLRIFENALGKLDTSVLDENGALLVVSQFTLFGDTKKGRRPSFEGAMEPQEARRLYEHFVHLGRAHLQVETGCFGAHMQVFSENNGPMTLWLDTAE